MKWPGIMAWGLLALAGMALIQPAPIMGAQELTVSAAASLTTAFPEIGKRFEQQHPGTKVIFNFAASGPLLQQIVQGAPVDVFASADQKTMNQAQEKGLIDVAQPEKFCEQYPGAHRTPGFQAHPEWPSKTCSQPR